MVKKKVLKAQIDLLTKKVNELMDDNENLNIVIKDLGEKVEYIYRQNGLLSENDNSLFDEWMNGAKKEGEN
jgi:hypothetical protein